MIERHGTGVGGGALSLEQRTELDRGEIELAFQSLTGPSEFPVFRAVTVRDFGDGLVEVGYSSVRHARDDRPKVSDLQGDMVPDAALTSPEANLGRSVRRTRAQVRRKCMAGGLDHLLTLTYRENVSDLSRCFSDFKRFVRLVRSGGREFVYLCVHEFQKRGAVHFHVAVRGWQDVRYLRSCWLAVVGSGNIDVKGPSVRGSSRWGRAHLSGYLVKYITKGVCSLSGRQRYRVAEGIEIPGETRVHEFPPFFDFVASIFESLGSGVRFHWKSDHGPWGWACSW